MQKSWIGGGPLHNFTSTSCILLRLLLNPREEKHCCISLGASLAGGTFKHIKHSQMRRMTCYCLILVPLPCLAAIAFGECLWHALLVKLFGTSRPYSSPNLWYFPTWSLILPFDVNPAHVSSLKKCHTTNVWLLGEGIATCRQTRGSSAALVPG